jgi:hypothetical protein
MSITAKHIAGKFLVPVTRIPSTIGSSNTILDASVIIPINIPGCLVVPLKAFATCNIVYVLDAGQSYCAIIGTMINIARFSVLLKEVGS